MGEGTITELLERWNEGDHKALDQLFPVIYEELRAMGQRILSRNDALTLQRTALVHEVFLRLLRQKQAHWNDRGHFFSSVARMMRQILVDHVREHAAEKRWGQLERMPLEFADGLTAAQGDRNLLDVHESLERLAELDSGRARLVEMRYFGGLTLEEIAEIDGVSLSTIKRDWNAAKLWLYSDIRGRGNGA